MRTKLHRDSFVRGFNRKALVLVSFLIAVPACLAGDVLDRIERSFSVKDRPVIYVRNSDGRTRIIASSGPEVKVVAVKEAVRNANPERARREAEAIEVRIQQTGDKVEAEARYPKNTGFFDHGPLVLVHFEITAPSASDVEAHNSDGALTVEGFDGRLDLSTSDGSLTATRCSGQINAHVSDGEMRFEALQGYLQARSSDGKVTADGTFKGLEVKSSDGDVDITVRPGSTMDRQWSIGSSDGSVRLRLPDGFDADLDASTSDGSINVDQPVTMNGQKLSEHHLAGKLNRGGQILRVHTSDGNITISR